MNFIEGFFLGMFFGLLFFEPFLINVIYFSNIALFEDIILTKKNKRKMHKFCKGEILNE